MYILDFGNIQFTDSNIKDKIEYIHQINPDGDMLLGVAAMAELKFTLYDLNHLITDTDITGREFTFKKSKTSTYLSKWDIFKASKPDIMCLNGETVYSVKKNVFSIDGKAVTQQPTEGVQCVYIVNSKVYLGHTDKVSVYTLQGAKQADIKLTPFQQTQIVQGGSLNMQGNTLKEYSTRLFDMKPTDFVEKTSIFSDVGIFTAVRPERKNKTNISVTSYDRMNKFSKVSDSFISNLFYPVTAFNLLSSLCQYVGVPLLTTSITNGTYPIAKKFSMSNTTARTILQYITELSGNFAYIDAAGRVVVRFYEATDKTYTGENFKTIRQLEYTTAKIDKVQVKTEKDDVGVIVPKSEAKPNAYVIENNPLMYTSSDAELRPYVQALFDKLKNFQYIPTEFTTVLDNDFEGNVGELITINGTQTPIFTKRIKGLIETYFGSGNAVRDTQTAKLNETVKMLSGKTNVLINTVDEFSVTLTEVKDTGEQNTAQLLIQADEITAEVTRATEAEGQLSSQILVQADQISLKVSQTDYNGNTISSLINQTSTSIKIQASKINLVGYATFSNLQDGVTTISGSNIKTGTVSADRLESNILTTDNIETKNLTLTGFFKNAGRSSTIRMENGELIFNSSGYTGERCNIWYNSSNATMNIDAGYTSSISTSLNLSSYYDIYMRTKSGNIFISPSSGKSVYIGSSTSNLGDIHANRYYQGNYGGHSGEFTYMKSATSLGRITVKGGIITNVT